MKLLKIVLLTACLLGLPAANSFCELIAFRSAEELYPWIFASNTYIVLHTFADRRFNLADNQYELWFQLTLTCLASMRPTTGGEIVNIKIPLVGLRDLRAGMRALRTRANNENWKDKHPGSYALLSQVEDAWGGELQEKTDKKK